MRKAALPLTSTSVDTGVQAEIEAIALSVTRPQVIFGPAVKSTASTADWQQIPRPGSLLVAACAHRDVQLTPTISGTGWAQMLLHATELTNDAARRVLVLWFKEAVDDEPESVTVTWAGANIRQRLTLVEFEPNQDICRAPAK